MIGGRGRVHCRVLVCTVTLGRCACLGTAARRLAGGVLARRGEGGLGSVQAPQTQRSLAMLSRHMPRPCCAKRQEWCIWMRERVDFVVLCISIITYVNILSGRKGPGTKRNRKPSAIVSGSQYLPEGASPPPAPRRRGLSNLAQIKAPSPSQALGLHLLFLERNLLRTATY